MLLVENEVMDTKEAAKFLKVSRTTLMKLVKEGVVPAQKMGGQWRFSRRALLSWLESGQAKEEK